MEQLAVSVSTGIIISFISSWLAVRLALRQFQSEKWWEKKTDYYCQLLDALHALCRSFSDNLDSAETGQSFTEDQQKFLNQIHKHGYDKVRHLHDIGGLFFPKVVIDTLDTFLKKIEYDEEQGYFEHVDIGSFETKKCIEEIIGLAKKDLAKISRTHD